MLTETTFTNLVTNNKINARVTDRDAGVEELAAQIKAQGLINPLTVRAVAGGKFEIIAGNRRRAAIAQLVKSKHWPADRLVPINVVDQDDAEARATSLMENIGRLNMHPVDAFEAFAALERDGKSELEIAQTYGIDERAVRQRLALGGLAADIRKAWRDGKISGEVAQAFAICADKKLQAKTYKGMAGRDITPYLVRAQLVNDKPKLTDPRVRFVGLDRYRAAGGVVVESLFENDGYLEDGALLKSLVSDALQERCNALVDEGWAFAVPASEFPHIHSAQRERGTPKYTPQAKARLKELTDAIEAIETDAKLSYDEQDERIEPLAAERDEIEDLAAARGFTKEQKAKTGCVLEVSEDGVSIRYGVYRPKEKKAAPASSSEASGSAAGAGVDQPDAGDISGALTETITRSQTAAAAKVVSTEPVLALLLLVAALQSTTPKCIDVALGGSGQGRHGVDYADLPVRLKKLKKGPSTVVVSDVLDDLARLVAASLDLASYNSHGFSKGTDELVALLPGDKYLAAMREEFVAADFFSRATATVAIAALEEMGEQPPKGAKKAALAELAANRARDTGWLPERLRHADYALIGVATPKKGKAKKAA